MRIVDDCPVSVSPMTDEVRRDLKDERDSEAYQAMYDEVYDEMCGYFFDWERETGAKPDGESVHNEALRRLLNG